MVEATLVNASTLTKKVKQPAVTTKKPSRRPLKVVMLIPYDLEKMPFAVRTHRYAEELSHRGHDVTVYFWQERNGKQIHTLPEGVHFKRGRLRFFAQMYQAIKDADVVHFQKSIPRSTLPAIALATLAGKPLYQDWDDYESFFWLQSLKDRVRQRAEPKHIWLALRRLITTGLLEWSIPKLVTTIGGASAELRKRSIEWGIEPGAIFPARVGVDIEKFHPQNRDEGLRAELGLADHPTIIFSGSLDLEGDLHFFTEALVHLFKKARDSRCLVVGGGFGRGELVRRIEELGLKRNIVMTMGLIPFADMPRYVASADIAALPFRNTPVNRGKSSLTLLESMASGLPAVSHDVGDVAWMMGEGGILAKPGDPVAYADALFELVSSPEKRVALGALARKRAVDHFQWHHAVDGVEDAYYAAVELHSRKGRRST